jgi:hypothetical protein
MRSSAPGACSSSGRACPSHARSACYCRGDALVQPGRAFLQDGDAPMPHKERVLLPGGRARPAGARLPPAGGHAPPAPARVPPAGGHAPPAPARVPPAGGHALPARGVLSDTPPTPSQSTDHWSHLEASRGGSRVSRWSHAARVAPHPGLPPVFDGVKVPATGHERASFSCRWAMGNGARAHAARTCRRRWTARRCPLRAPSPRSDGGKAGMGGDAKGPGDGKSGETGRQMGPMLRGLASCISRLVRIRDPLLARGRGVFRARPSASRARRSRG